MKIAPVREKILEHLIALKDSGAIETVYDDQFAYNPLAKVPPKYPVAVIASPSFTSDFLDNETNERTFTFDILFAVNESNIKSNKYFCDELKEKICDRFDSDYQLGGTVMMQAAPASSVVTVEHLANDTLGMFTITLVYKTTQDVE